MTERARLDELAYVRPRGLKRLVAAVIAQVPRDRGGIAGARAHALRAIVITVHDGDIDIFAFELAVHARWLRVDPCEAERGGDPIRIVARDQNIDIARVRRRVHARAVRLDDRARIRDSTNAREHAFRRRHFHASLMSSCNRSGVLAVVLHMKPLLCAKCTSVSCSTLEKSRRG